MKTIAEILDHKPSKAIYAMIEGLQYYSKQGNFQIEMETFGDSDKQSGICYGCAATCTVQKIFDKSLTVDTISTKTLRSRFFDTDRDDLYIFEDAIDDLRTGFVVPLFKYMGIVGKKLVTLLRSIAPIELPALYTEYWKDNIQAYKDFADLLKSKGY